MITSIRIKNFKALQDTDLLTIPELSVFIGNNGSGKSSVIEALRVLQRIIDYGIQYAFQDFGRLEDIRHYEAKYNEPEVTPDGFKKLYRPIEFEVNALIKGTEYHYELKINSVESGDLYVIESEVLMKSGQIVFWRRVLRNDGFSVWHYDEGSEKKIYGDIFPAGAAFSNLFFPSEHSEPSILEFGNFLRDWQFLNLNAHLIGQPIAQNKTTNIIRLSSDARNLADFVRYYSLKDENFLSNLLRKVQFVLPYADIIRSASTSGFKEEVRLEMYEQGQKGDPIPGWLFSGGTLRILALLAVLNQPELPSTLFIDEIENGLDPRTIGLLLSEIRSKVMSQKMQVVATTHSPYFLDMVELRHIIVAEKEGVNTIFNHPDSNEKLNSWKEKFSPGQLYTMGQLNQAM